MRKHKLYQRLKTVTLLLLLLATITGCNQKKAAPDNLLSIIIMGDSSTVYTGDLKKNTPFEEIANNERIIKELIARKKRATDKELTVLFKLSVEKAGLGFMDQIADVIRWVKESGINNMELIDITEMDQAVFKLPATSWSLIDSLAKPVKLELNMPKEKGGLDVEKIDKTAPYVLSVMVVSPDEWYYYTGPDATNVSLLNRREYSSLLKRKKKQWGEKLIVLSNIAPGAAPESIVASLEEKANSGIKNYELLFPSAPPATMPKRKLTPEHFLRMSQNHIAKKTPNTVSADKIPVDNAFLIEIREDNSVWYQPLSKTSRIVSQKVNPPVSKNMGRIISDYAKVSEGAHTEYFIKGHPKSTYPPFEQILQALKNNNILKYNLVTE